MLAVLLKIAVALMIVSNARAVWYEARRGRSPFAIAAFLAAVYVLLAFARPWWSTAFFICVCVLFSGGGRWLRRMARKAAASLTSIQETALRREVEATR